MRAREGETREVEDGPVAVAVMGSATRRGSIASFFQRARRDDAVGDESEEEKTTSGERKRVKTSTMDSGSRFRRCPICDSNVANVFFASHVDACEGVVEKRPIERSGVKSIARSDDVCTPAKDGTKNAFASMMAAQRERERVRSYALSYDESRERWRVTLGKTSPLSESKRAWSGQVVVKEKLASGSTCATTLKLAVDVNGDFKGSERDRFILQGLSDAREFSEVRASRERAGSEELKVSLIKSALQKNIRRGRAVAASRIATHMCLSSSSFVELVRRLVIISVEDAILHPDIAVLTWLMCATSKGFEPTDALRASVIRIAGELAAVQVRDEPAYGPNTPLTLNDVETKLSESPDESTVVQSLIIRAHFGGMPGDVAMLHGFSRVWLERFTQMSCDANVPVDYDALLNPEIIESDVKSPWLTYLELIFDATTENERTHFGGFMRRDDIPIAAVDFHVSSCVENVLQVPSIRLKVVDAGKSLGFGDDMNVTDRVKSAIWRHSAGVNHKQPIELRRDARKGGEQGLKEPCAKEKLSLEIWNIISEELERWVRRYLAFRVPR